MTVTESPLLLSVSVVAQRASLSPRQVYRLIASGELTAVKVGRRTLVRRTDFEEWVNQLR